MLNARFILIIFLIFINSTNGCNKEDPPIPDSFLASIDSNEYFEEDIFPADSQFIYGIWQLYDITGGYSGDGKDPEYDYVEFKKNGIWGCINSMELVDYGRLYMQYSKTKYWEGTVIGFIPDSLAYLDLIPINTYMVSGNTRDSICLNSSLSHGYNYYFERIK